MGPPRWMAPTFYLTVKGLEKYGYRKEAKRIASKYLDLVTKNFLTPNPATFISRKKRVGEEVVRKPGFVYEKYNVEKGIIHDAEYASRSFHGWSYGVFMWCLNYLSEI